MILKLDGAIQRFSAGFAAATMGMVCAGHPAFQTGLLEENTLASLAYWSVCSAFAMATVGLSFVAVLKAREHLQSLEGQLAAKTIPAAATRFNRPFKSHKIGA